MKAGWMMGGAAALLAGCAGEPLPAQEEISCNSCWMSPHTHAPEVVEILVQGGVELTDDGTGVRALDGGHARRKYCAVVVQAPSLRPGDAAAVLRHAARWIESSGDPSTFLRDFVDRRAGLLAGAQVRQAFFAAAGSLQSNGDRARVLVHVLHAAGERTAVAADVLHAAGAIGPDAGRTRVLTRVPRAALGGPGVAEAYRSALQTIRSDGDRRRAQNHLFGPR